MFIMNTYELVGKILFIWKIYELEKKKVYPEYSCACLEKNLSSKNIFDFAMKKISIYYEYIL